MYKYRKATENDFEAICNLIKSKQELFLIYPNGQFPLTVAQLNELAKVRKELTVMVKDSTIIGFANLYNYKQNESAFIGNVVIDKNHRGRGLGKNCFIYARTSIQIS